MSAKLVRQWLADAEDLGVKGKNVVWPEYRVAC
jgi:hypothetical protein